MGWVGKLYRVDHQRQAVSIECCLEGRVIVGARQLPPHNALVLLEGVPRRVGGGTAARARRGSLEL